METKQKYEKADGVGGVRYDEDKYQKRGHVIYQQRSV